MTVSPAARRFVRLALVLMLALGALPMGAFADELPAAPVATTLTLIAGASGTGSPAQVTGHLTDAIGTPIADAAIALESSTDTVSWTSADALTTNASGDFSGSRAVGRTTYFRASYAGLADAYAASEPTVAVSTFTPVVTWVILPRSRVDAKQKFTIQVSIGVYGTDDATCTGIFGLSGPEVAKTVIGRKSVDTTTGMVVYTATVSASRSGNWLATFELGQDLAHAGAVAPGRGFSVGDSDLTVSGSPGSVQIGKRITFKGKLKSRQSHKGISGVTVKMQKSVSGHWSTVASAKSRAGGKISIAVRLKTRGTFRLVSSTTNLWRGRTSLEFDVRTYFKLTGTAARDYKSNKVYLTRGSHRLKFSGVGFRTFWAHSQNEKTKIKLDPHALFNDTKVEINTAGYYHFRIADPKGRHDTWPFSIKIYN